MVSFDSTTSCERVDGLVVLPGVVGGEPVGGDAGGVVGDWPKAAVLAASIAVATETTKSSPCDRQFDPFMRRPS